MCLSQIRHALHEHAGIDGAAPILEIGCGTGRIGSQFTAGGDNYLGVDLSLGMLREFQQKNLMPEPTLVCADGCLLPFGDSIFRAVLMVHLTAVRNWRDLLLEALRVLEPDGVLAIGLIEGPPDGVDMAMRSRLNELIAECRDNYKIVRPPRRRANGWQPNAPAMSKSSPRNGPWSTARVSSYAGSRLRPNSPCSLPTCAMPRFSPWQTGPSKASGPWIGQLASSTISR